MFNLLRRRPTMIRALRGNRIPIPDTRQKSGYTCGPAALSAIFSYWGEFVDEEDLALELGSDPVGGTPPVGLMQAAMKRGYQTAWHERMTNQELKHYLEEGRPVVIAVQAWASTPAELAGDSGHYVIAIDYDDTNVYFEDPALDDARGYIPWQDFEDRWHDKDKTGRPYSRLGLAIWKDERPVTEAFVEAISMILFEDKAPTKGVT
jgi:predicted double-glycine peptidase